MAPVWIGLIAAVVALLPSLVRGAFPGVGWYAPILIFAVAGVAMLLQRFVMDRQAALRRYDGLADLVIHIHSPGDPDTAGRWSLRAAISFLIALFGGQAGPEGAATELGHAFAIRARPRSARWSEHQRRTDAASALAAGIAASFGAPFAAMLVPVEMGIGGRSLSAVLSALVAYLAVRTLPSLLPAGRFPVDSFDLSGSLQSFRPDSWREWACALAIAIAAGLVAVGLIKLLRYCQESLSELFQTQAWIRTFGGGLLLFLLALAFAGGHAPASQLLEAVIWSRRSVPETALLFCSQILGLALVVSAFGTIGIFWPLFAIGGFLGYLVDQALFRGVPGFGGVAALVGAAAVWGGVLNAPIAGAAVAFELTGNPALLLPALLASFLAREARVRLGVPPLLSLDLEARGLTLVEGRSVEVLGSLRVGDAMVSDHESVHEQEPVSELHQRLLKSKYPFMPVVNSQGVYVGILTADLIQEAWEAQDPLAAHLPLQKLLEAKDLLYRSQRSRRGSTRIRTVKANDRLSVVVAHFGMLPCLPVIGDDGRVQGLLFSYGVRLAYEREVARRALALQHQAD